MANLKYSMTQVYTGTVGPGCYYYVCDTDAGKPVTGLNKGDLAWCNDTGNLYIATSTTTWDRMKIVGTGADPPAASFMGLVNRFNVNAAIGSTLLTNATPASHKLYRISYCLRTYAALAGTGTLVAEFTYTDYSGSVTLTSAPITLNSTTAVVQGVFVVHLLSGDISYKTTLTGSIATSTYNLFVRCEYLG